MVGASFVQTITLAGQARDIGRQVGAVAREALRRRLVAQLGEEGDWPGLVEHHADRLRAFRDLLAGAVPHWLQEAEGIAEAADVPVDVLLLVNSGAGKLSPPAAGDCTSFMVIGSASGCGGNLLHKNRDEKRHPQTFFAKHVDGQNRLLASAEVGGLGVAQMVNEHGLAGGNDTGPPITTGGGEIGLDDRQVLRIVGERARDCEGALEVCEELVAAGLVAALDGHRGMVFLFADPVRGLVVEMTPAQVWHNFCDDGLVCRSNHFLLAEAQCVVRGPAIPAEQGSSTMLRHARAEELLRPRVGSLRPEDLMAAGRDTAGYPKSLCNDTTVSMMTHRLAVEAERRVSWVCNGYPLLAATKVWPHGDVDTPVEYLDGSSWVAPPVPGRDD
jgi:hypothetical protein